jgi:hypothetical protein
VWQAKFEKYRKLGFTVVGIALDAEGIGPAKRYYDHFGVEFPSLVDPNYATGFAAVPKTFFVDEHGVVQSLDDWEQRLRPQNNLKPVSDAVRRQWSDPGVRLNANEIARLSQLLRTSPGNLSTAVDLASRYQDLGLPVEARSTLIRTVDHFDALTVAQSSNDSQKRLLGQAYLQLARASTGNRADQVRYATFSFYLNPSVGFGKQIARIIAPEKFDGRPGADFDNTFREATLRRLRREREEWLAR